MLATVEIRLKMRCVLEESPLQIFNKRWLEDTMTNATPPLMTTLLNKIASTRRS